MAISYLMKLKTLQVYHGNALFRICDTNAQPRRVFITGTYVSSRHFEKSFRSI